MGREEAYAGIITALRETEVALANGKTVDQARHVKELEHENARLKRAVAKRKRRRETSEPRAKTQGGGACAPAARGE